MLAYNSDSARSMKTLPVKLRNPQKKFSLFLQAIYPTCDNATDLCPLKTDMQKKWVLGHRNIPIC